MKKNEQKAPRVARVKIVGVSPYTQGKAFSYESKKKSDETGDQYDERMWRERAHFNTKGNAVIPGAAIHKALIAAGQFRGERIPGAGTKTWTKRFGAGVMVLENPEIQPKVKKKDLAGVMLHLPSDGLPGGSKRVWKRFPIFEEWSATVDVTVVDGLIDEETFLRHVDSAGKFVGIGTYRPGSRSAGTNGRFAVESVEWSEI